MSQLIRLFYVAWFALLVACQAYPDPATLVRSHQLTETSVTGGEFDLRVMAAATGKNAALHIYLGGDGRPWQGQQPAADPTGKRNIALELMIRDPAPALYLGRPCYHQDGLPQDGLPQQTLPAACDPALWTSGRYSPRVVASLVAAIRSLARARGAQQLTLIGYSGGGVLAVLAAPELADLGRVRVITVAANLDTEAWTRHHRLLPLGDSLNPAGRPPGAPAVHLQGARDTVVPPASVKAYAAAHPRDRFIVVEDADHRCCWTARWEALLPRALALLDGGEARGPPAPVPGRAPP